MSDRETHQSGGYIELLRSNGDFRRLWTGLLISQTGDWFNTVALFTLMLNLTGSGESVGYVLIIKLLPAFFAGPLAGVVADRFNRKIIMITADLFRAVTVLGFLFIHSPDQVWMVYVITCFQVMATTFFDPAMSAMVPSIVERRHLIAANALSSVSWSITLAFGAAVGGLFTNWFGREAAFIIDSATFFISAAFVSSVKFPARKYGLERRERKLSLTEITGISDIIEGAKYLKSNKRVMALLLVKSGWGMGGGVLLLLTIFGKQIFPLGLDGSASIGLLYAARGFGALIGPMIARAITGVSVRTMRQAIAVAFVVSTVFYLLFAWSPSIWAASIFVIGAHAGGSIQWVFSTVLLQMTVSDRFLGRVFALELALLTLTMSVSTYLTGWGIDYGGVSPRQMAAILGFAFLVPGLLWFIAQRRMGHDDETTKLDDDKSLEAAPAD
jgi:MFS family permease